MLPAASIDLLKALLDATAQAARAGREDATIDALALARAIDPAARAPWRNEPALAEAIRWCRESGAPLLPALIVMDAAYRSPESRFLVLAYGSLPRAEALERWREDVAAASALPPAKAAQLRDALAAEAARLSPAAPSGEKQRSAGTAKRPTSSTAARRASAKPRAATPTRTARTAKTAPQPGRSAARVRLQTIDAARLSAALEALCAAAPDDDPLAPARAQAADALAAWDLWDENLGLREWDALTPGDGDLVQMVAMTAESPQATWIARSGGAPALSHKLRSGAHRLDGVELFETALVRFFADELTLPAFLDAQRDLLGRQYPLVSHLLFLKDPDAFVPVCPAPAEAGLHALGVDLLLSGYCTAPGYERLLACLDDLRALLARSGHAATRLEAAAFLEMLQ